MSGRRGPSTPAGRWCWRRAPDGSTRTSRLEPELRRDAEAVLDEGESLSHLVATCVRDGVAWRRTRDAFLLRARDAVERSERLRAPRWSQLVNVADARATVRAHDLRLYVDEPNPTDTATSGLPGVIPILPVIRHASIAQDEPYQLRKAGL